MIMEAHLQNYYIIRGQHYNAVWFVEYVNDGEPPRLTAESVRSTLATILWLPISIPMYLKRKLVG
jgi:hypothetical protein